MNDLIRARASVVDQTTVLVIFRIAQQQYGLPLPMVIEIVRLPALVPLAGAPPALCGLLNLRGQYLPVLGGHVLVGEPPRYDLTSQIIIAGRAQPELGLLVDQVHQICTVATTQIAPIAQHQGAAFLSGVCNHTDGSVLLVDLPELLMVIPNQTSSQTSNGTKRRRGTHQN